MPWLYLRGLLLTEREWLKGKEWGGVEDRPETGRRREQKRSNSSGAQTTIPLVAPIGSTPL